ncbi:ornithine cyclodeaminase family protein [Brucella anthropi]|uniref:Ornithine cyclodeaminase family protein n=1 Tax=Brucella anthropi TaxID=529 RepID=A0A6L3YYQ6_BRUAN|nr:ornithine cyclodeaminase family protein [Brucella anthropi]KAB2759583.1 ornithine cyclodeaminase family protein [Brucella anthropi]
MIGSDLKIINAEETATALPYRALIDALQAGFVTGCTAPVRHHHHMDKICEPNATLLLMPAWSKPSDPDQFLGVKLVTVVPGNTSRGLPSLTSTYILYDGITGQQLALMDGNVITARRTVATSALAARYLAREDSKVLLVVGAGRVASQIPAAYRAVRPIEKVIVWDINAEGAATFARSLNEMGIEAVAMTDLQNAVGVADIISSATLATAPLIKGEWVRRGTHIDLIGGFTPKMREADDAALKMARTFVDTSEALHEAGDLVQPIQDGVVTADHIRGTLADLANAKLDGRTSADEITYFKAVGSALADLVAARMVFNVVRT